MKLSDPFDIETATLPELHERARLLREESTRLSKESIRLREESIKHGKRAQFWLTISLVFIVISIVAQIGRVFL